MKYYEYHKNMIVIMICIHVDVTIIMLCIHVNITRFMNNIRINHKRNHIYKIAILFASFFFFFLSDIQVRLNLNLC